MERPGAAGFEGGELGAWRRIDVSVVIEGSRMAFFGVPEGVAGGEAEGLWEGRGVDQARGSLSEGAWSRYGALWGRGGRREGDGGGRRDYG